MWSGRYSAKLADAGFTNASNEVDLYGATRRHDQHQCSSSSSSLESQLAYEAENPMMTDSDSMHGNGHFRDSHVSFEIKETAQEVEKDIFFMVHARSCEIPCPKEKKRGPIALMGDMENAVQARPSSCGCRTPSIDFMMSEEYQSGEELISLDHMWNVAE